LVYIFCGKGNNGGDGFVIARHLWDNNISVKIFIIGDASDFKDDSATNFKIIQKSGILYKFIDSAEKLEINLNHYPDLIVDALLGTGIEGAVRGFMREVIKQLNEIECPIISVDVPSGLNADSPIIDGEAIKADVTVTMALPKRCHVFYPAKAFSGELFIADIGIPPAIRKSDKVSVQMVEASDIVLPKRPDDAHKYSCGKIAVLAGSPGYTGAAVLTSEAALRMGAGLVILAIPASLHTILETKLTEVITRPYVATENECFSLQSLKELEELFEWCDVLAIGPGLGRSEETRKAILHLLKGFNKPAVIDADALFALANPEGKEEVLKTAQSNWILTPHHGEFLRFLGNTSKEELRRHIIEISADFAQLYNIHLLLKGAPSLIAAPDGQIYVNPSGNSGLASGGSGDVLTGMVAGLLGQSLLPTEAGYIANYLHGLCADTVVEGGSKYSLVAGDLLDQLPSVLNKL
jgi:NAD(P)H-hydrate epimerase